MTTDLGVHIGHTIGWLLADPMRPIWVGNLILWSALALFMLCRGALATFTKDAREGDPMRLACLLVAVLFVSGNARWLLAPGSIALWQAVGIASMGVCLLIFWLAKSYGRGARVR